MYYFHKRQSLSWFFQFYIHTTPAELVKSAYACSTFKHSLSKPPRRRRHSLSDLVASIFVRLYNKQVELTKPSLAKTRQWRVYRRVLDKIFIKIFMLTPSNLLFRCYCYSAVTQHTEETLMETWGIFGRINVSHSIYVLFSDALHVEASAEEDTLFLSQDVLSRQEELYNLLPSQVKSCILESIRGAGTQNRF